MYSVRENSLGDHEIIRNTQEPALLKSRLLAYYSWKQLEKRSIKIRNTFTDASKEVNMKKVACAVLIFTMVIFLINPLPSEARGGHGGGGGHWSGGGHGGWWVPWAILGGAAILAPYFYSPYDEPPPVMIREQPPVYFQPVPSVMPSSTERIFVYPRLGQTEELQAKDRYECHSWALSQTGYDPTQPSAGDMPAAQRNQMSADYQRAQGACLDGRGYTVK